VIAGRTSRTIQTSKILIAGLLAAVLSACGAAAYKNTKLPIDTRIDDLLGRLTPEEKVNMVSGGSWMDTRPVPRLAIPALKMNDGPLGVRYWSPNLASTQGSFGATAFPAGVAMAATWDPELVEREGRAIAQQVRAFGRNMLLGPTVNIARLPQWGRNFEAYGEDPYLASRMAVAYIRGVQKEGVIATVKHFAANNQEFERHRVDVRVTERALQEVYFPAFRAAIQEAGVGAVMSSYNKVNGKWAAENPYLLTDVLRKQMGFKGLVVSDWASTHTTVETANAGLDIEMPGLESLNEFLKNPARVSSGFIGGFMSPDKLLPAVRSGQVSQAVLAEKVRRILWAMMMVGVFDRAESQPTNVVDTPDQQAVAREAAVESMVLLKNSSDVLPLNPAGLKSIAVIGPNAVVARTGGGGSSRVTPKSQPASPLDEIKRRAGSGVQVGYAQGCSIPSGAEVGTPAASSHLREEAVALAAKSDAAIIFAGYSPETEQEHADRTLGLPAGQDELIQAVAKAARRTIVVLYSGGPVLMNSWLDQVPALLLAWYPGQEAGRTPATVLFGDANPSGKLPVTFIKDWKDSSAYPNYPGKDLRVDYAEGIYVGYRHFDKENIQPLFPFGHGLSYTSFAYSDLKVTPERSAPGQPVTVTLHVKNTGARPGAEIVQIYIGASQSEIDRPVKELKGFRRIALGPGEAQLVTITIDGKAMAHFDDNKKAWVSDTGVFKVEAGASSRDIRQRASFEILAH
jgi:beta-glucosidase